MLPADDFPDLRKGSWAIGLGVSTPVDPLSALGPVRLAVVACRRSTFTQTASGRQAGALTYLEFCVDLGFPDVRVSDKASLD